VAHFITALLKVRTNGLQERDVHVQYSGLDLFFSSDAVSVALTVDRLQLLQQSMLDAGGLEFGVPLFICRCRCEAPGRHWQHKIPLVILVCASMLSKPLLPAKKIWRRGRANQSLKLV
jgi:hypothetical protein